MRNRAEFARAGVYILTGTAEGTDDDLPTVYVGQAEEIGYRVESHFAEKDFWDWGYAFVSNGNPLNRLIRHGLNTPSCNVPTRRSGVT